MLQLTGIDLTLDNRGIGYIINMPSSSKFLEQIRPIQTAFRKQFGTKVYCPEGPAVHITLLDLLTTCQTYSKEELKEFEIMKSEYIHVISDILTNYHPFEITFDTIELFPPCIILKAKDQGEFQSIRTEFMKRTELIGETKAPPPIIHSTIVAFREAISLQETKSLLQRISFPFQETVKEFRLVREHQNRHQDFEVLRTLYLQ